jgi:PAS domain S-box-containing protein
MRRNKDKPQASSSPGLRQQAEAQVSGAPAADVSTLSLDEIRALVHELQVHQVELEIQNENLRATQRELADARDRYFNLYELAPIGYITLDRNRRVRSANLTAAEVLSVDRDRLIGAHLEAFIAQEDRDACYFVLRRAAGTPDRHTAELHLDAEDGTNRWVLLEVAWTGSEEPDADEWRVTLRDITPRKNAENALREWTRQFERLADNAPDIVFRVDREFRHVFVNQRMLNVTGMRREEFLGRTSRQLGRPPELCDLWEQVFAKTFESRQPQEAEFAYETLLGLRFYQMRLVPELAPDGSVETVLGITRDITEQKRAEEALRRMNEMLEQRVAERTGMLKLLNDVATTANEARCIDEALEYTLKRVSEYNGWSFGHAYLLEEGDPPLLVPVRTFYEAAPGRFRRFQAATLKTRLRPGQGLPGRALAAKAVQWADDIEQELVTRRAEVGSELGVCCGAAFPIFAGDEVVGVLEFFSDRQIERTDRLLESMAGIGTQLGRVVERQRFEKNLGRALLAERERLGLDLHDTVGQQMAGLALIAERMAHQAESGTPPDATTLSALSNGLRHALADTRTVVRDLLPLGVTDAETYSVALQALADTVSQRYDVACEIDCPRPVSIGAPDVAGHLYHIAAEAVTNAAKHARARWIVLHLAVENDMLVLEVRDDGVGIRADADTRGSGLWIMQHRANVIGASLDIRRGPEGGTTVRCVLPEDQLRRPVTEEA